MVTDRNLRPTQLVRLLPILLATLLAGCLSPGSEALFRGDDEAVVEEAPPQPPTASELRYARGIEVRRGMIESWFELVDPPENPSRLRLRCVDEGGNGIEGAEIRFLEYRAEFTEWTGGVFWHRHGAPHLVSGPDGWIEGIAPTELTLTIELVVPGRATRQLLRGWLRPGQVLDLGTLTFPPGGGVEGLILDPEGKPCPDRFIGLAQPNDPVAADVPEMAGGWGFIYVRTDASGRFRCDDLAPGVTTVHFDAWPSDRRPEDSVPMPQRFEVFPGETKSLVLHSPDAAAQRNAPLVRFPEGCGGLRVWIVPSSPKDDVYWLDEVELAGFTFPERVDPLEVSVPGIQNSLLLQVAEGKGTVTWGEPLSGWEFPAEGIEVEVVAGVVTEVIVPARPVASEFDADVDPPEPITIPIRVVDPFGDPLAAVVTTDRKDDPFIWTNALGEGALVLEPLARGEERKALRCSTRTLDWIDIPWEEVLEQLPLEAPLPIILGEGAATLYTTARDPMGEKVGIDGLYGSGTFLVDEYRMPYPELLNRLPWQWSANRRVPIKPGVWQLEVMTSDGLWHSEIGVEVRAGEHSTLSVTIPPRRMLEFSITLDGKPVALSHCDLDVADHSESPWTDSRGRVQTPVRTEGPITIRPRVDRSKIQNEWCDDRWSIETTFDELHGSTIELSEYPEEE